MRTDKDLCNRKPACQELIAERSQHIGAPIPAADSTISPTTDSTIDPAPESKVDWDQHPAYNQPHVLIASPNAKHFPPTETQVCIDSCLFLMESAERAQNPLKAALTPPLEPKRRNPYVTQKNLVSDRFQRAILRGSG